MIDHWYTDPHNGKEYGPFTAEEREDLDATARKPISWRTSVRILTDCDDVLGRPS